MKNIVCSLLILVGMLFFSCQSKSYPSFVYHQTQCADVWEIGQNPQTDEELIFLFENYLNSKGIFLTEVEFQFTPILSCHACDCPSGGRFKVIPASPLMKLLLIGEGFVEE